jgi:signal transduction histidine kinase
VVKENREKAEKKNISISSDLQEDLYINTDSKAFEQILENLISNAVKFTIPGKNIRIRAAEINNTVHIEVVDSGPGLTDGDMQKLFGRFTRLSAQPTGNENSTGLGLSIAKKLTELLSGKIWCENNAPNGAAFKLEFPASKE